MKTALYILMAVLTIGIATAQSAYVYYVGNGAAVTQGECIPTTFTLEESTYISSITDYHWNGGVGSTPGTISLKDQDDTMYGPWAASGSTYWVVNPDITLPAGTYTVIDSQMSTWAYNSQSGNMCMSWGEGYANELPAQIPEFGLIAGSLAAIGAVGVLMFIRRN